MREQMIPVDTQHLLLISVANAIEAQQRRTPGRSAGVLEGVEPPVSWEQGNDPNSFVYHSQGYVVRVTHYSGGVRSFERLENPTADQQILGSNAIFTANLKSCQDTIWVQFIERDFNFYRPGSANPIRRHLNPEIDGTVPYKFQYQPGPGLAIMNDDAGVVVSQSLSDKRGIAIAAIPSYAAEAGIPAAGINQVTARYKYWTYLICLKPYGLVGHFEWGYSADIDKMRSSYTTAPQPIRWVGYTH